MDTHNGFLSLAESRVSMQAGGSLLRVLDSGTGSATIEKIIFPYIGMVPTRMGQAVRMADKR